VDSRASRHTTFVVKSDSPNLMEGSMAKKAKKAKAAKKTKRRKKR
jgi:hypothetical protein